MKALHLLRHAKSAWDNPGLSDRDRPLNKRGRGDAPRIGKALAKSLVAMPVAVSPARRAQLTLEGLCAGWPELAEVTHRTEEDLYTFSHDAVADWIALQDDDLEALFLIGHNPAFTDLVNALVGEYCLDNLPTAGYAELVLEIDRWRDLAPSCGSLSRTIFPRQLPED
jgi:phosphohistidine phosphatase